MAGPKRFNSAQETGNCKALNSQLGITLTPLIAKARLHEINKNKIAARQTKN